MWYDLKTRIISAIIMIIIALPILLIGGIPFKFFAVILGLFALYELLKVKETEKEFPAFLKFISFIILAFIIYFGSNNDISYHLEYMYIIFPFFFVFLPIIFINNNSKYNINDALFLIGSIIFLGIVFNIFIIVRETNLNNFIYLLLITIFTDTFALISGKLIGRHKLCEKISPNKTVEGTICGSIFGTIIATMYYYIIINSSINILFIITVTLILSIIGQLGDLFFSSIKRNYNVKDFSNLIPGHGGILDRLDSLIFVIMLYMLFINIL